MTPEETERMKHLCQQIQVEKDHLKFTSLVMQLNDLLEQKEHRLESKGQPYEPSCAVCHKPCPVEDCVTDEQGQAVHKECYASRVTKPD